jgi:hypothetical protein
MLSAGGAGTAALGRVRPVPLGQRHRRADQGGRPGQGLGGRLGRLDEQLLCERRAAAEVGARAALTTTGSAGFAAGAVQTAGSADRSVQPGGRVTKSNVLVSVASLWSVHDAV